MSDRAIILAAGRGSRMGEETALKPKCMTRLQGKILLEWQLEALKSAGIIDITVVRGYRADMLEGEFATADNPRWSETNMVASLFCAPAPTGHSIISYSDIAYHPSHIEKLKTSNHDITITADLRWEALWALRFEDPLDDAESFIHENGRLLEIGQKTEDIGRIQAQYMGLLNLSVKGWQIMYDQFMSLPQERRDKLDMTGMLNLLLSNNILVHVEFIEGKWCETDSYEDVLCYEAEMERNPNWSHDWR